jgi:pimeloyl-ACP methyl ester carboxylesterase
MEHPTSSRTIQKDGLSIFYREAGPKNAPTLLLLYGLRSSSRLGAAPTQAHFAQTFVRWRRRRHATSGTIRTWNAMSLVSGPMNLPF